MLDSEAQQSVLLGGRNGAAQAALEAALEAGAGRVALLYGSAHLPDLERRLVQDLGFVREPGDAQWLDAWTIALPAGAPGGGGAAAVPRGPPGGLGGPRLTQAQTAGLVGLSLMLATDLMLWEAVFRWAADLAEKL